jgi:hypothetical protein
MKTTKWYEPCDRYNFDFDVCSHTNGWYQIDTSQDASYYGNWCNPTELKFMSYVEGDCTLKQCESKEEFVAEVKSIFSWNQEMGFKCAIDNYKDREIFNELGLAHLCH